MRARTRLELPKPWHCRAASSPIIGSDPTQVSFVRSFVRWLVGLTCLHQSNRPTRRLGDRVSWTYVPCNVGMGGRPRLAFRRFFRLLVHKHKFVKSNERCQDPTITQRRPKTPKTNLSAGGRVFSRVCD